MTGNTLAHGPTRTHTDKHGRGTPVNDENQGDRGHVQNAVPGATACSRSANHAQDAHATTVPPTTLPFEGGERRKAYGGRIPVPQIWLRLCCAVLSACYPFQMTGIAAGPTAECPEQAESLHTCTARSASQGCPLPGRANLDLRGEIKNGVGGGAARAVFPHKRGDLGKPVAAGRHLVDVAVAE